jgi:tetratricopeptide (TPR) repeat protein
MVGTRGFAGILWLGAVLLAFGCTPVQNQKKTQTPDSHYTWGVSCLREGKPTLALAQFLEAEKNKPRDPDIQAALGQTYQLKGAYAEAERHYLRALELRPGEPRYQNNLGALYLDMRRLDDAQAYLEKAAGNLLFTDTEVSLTGIGNVHFLKGDHLAAVKSYREALAKNPRYVEAYLRLGETLSAMGQPERALTEYRKALALAPEYARLHFYLGLTYMKLGETARARESFDKVRQQQPESELGLRAADYLELLR